MDTATTSSARVGNKDHQPSDGPSRERVLVDLDFSNLMLHEIVSLTVSLYSGTNIEYNSTDKLLCFYKLSDEDQKNVILKVQSVGLSAGKKLSLDFNHNSDMKHLQVIKYVCKEVYHSILGRQIDGLKTNHQGVFYLLDKQLLAGSHINFDKSLENYNAKETEKQSKCLELYPTFIASILEGFLDKPVTFSIENNIVTYIIKY